MNERIMEGKTKVKIPLISQTESIAYTKLTSRIPQCGTWIKVVAPLRS